VDLIITDPTPSISGVEHFEIGEEEEIELKIGAAEVLKVEVPEGKVWIGSLHLHIHESDA